jgi:hypothetical protein
MTQHTHLHAGPPSTNRTSALIHGTERASGPMDREVRVTCGWHLGAPGPSAAPMRGPGTSSPQHPPCARGLRFAGGCYGSPCLWNLSTLTS